MTTSLKRFWPALLLGLLTLIFFWKILLTNLILVGVDVFLYFYPYKAYASEALRAGRLPLWNPHLFMGVPFLANSQVGLLYPPNWLFLWAEPPKQVAYSIGLHIWWAGLGAYLFAQRVLRLNPGAAFVGAAVFAFSGFLGAQVEHVNQLQVSAWLPWAFLLFDRLCTPLTPLAPATTDSAKSHSLDEPVRQAAQINPLAIVLEPLQQSWANRERWHEIWARRRYLALLGLVLGLMLLAGHPQSLYIVACGLGVYALTRGDWVWAGWAAAIRQVLRNSLNLVPLLAAGGLGLLLAMAQLLPTAELSAQSIRSGGLTYRETVAFSLNPRFFHLSFFPPYTADLEAQLGPAFSEYVAYVGLLPLLLIPIAGLVFWRQQKRLPWALLALGGVGAVLAFGVYTGPIYYGLYQLMPGFDLFRVPARWLLLYTFAAAMLTAISLSILLPRSWLYPVTGGLILLELFIASQALRYNMPTAAEAYSFKRPAILQLLASQGPTDRFLSMSDTRYDPGDQQEIYQIFENQLPERAIYDYVVATKQKEVLAYNLPLIYGLNSIDGYDGGILPLENFLDLQRVILDEDNLSLDGRLREKLDRVPPGRLLSWLGVRHVVTDKVYDIWLDDIFYDLQFPAVLAPGQEVWTTDVPVFPATAIGVVFEPNQPDTPAATLILEYQNGEQQIFTLSAENSTAWSDFNYYRVYPGLRDQTIRAMGLLAQGGVRIRGISLIHEPSVTSRSVLLSTEGNYRVVHGGDVKIYENLDALPRAWLVPQAIRVPDVDAAVEQLRSPNFNPEQQIVLIDPTAGSANGGSPPTNNAPIGQINIQQYTPELVELTASLREPGWLFLSDTDYPGWQATLNGEIVPIQRANLMFRAIALPPGDHEIRFRFVPRSLQIGSLLSLLGLLAIALLTRKSRSTEPEAK